MDTVTSLSDLATKQRLDPDRIGIFASALCAVHCALTPILLLILPTFGRAWSHPASHWGMALFVVPVAAFTLTRGFQQHRRRWVVGAGVLGIGLVILGAAVPYIGESQVRIGESQVRGDGGTGASSPPKLAMANISEEQVKSELRQNVNREEPCASECEGLTAETSTTECEDPCCPTLQASADGGWKLHIPFASILTTLGGLSLIATHFGNICCCAACAKQSLTN